MKKYEKITHLIVKKEIVKYFNTSCVHYLYNDLIKIFEIKLNIFTKQK